MIAWNPEDIDRKAEAKAKAKDKAKRFRPKGARLTSPTTYRRKRDEKWASIGQGTRVPKV